MYYIMVDQIISMVLFLKYGFGVLMVKLGVEVVYWNVMVFLSNYYLLGMKWRGQYFVDLVFFFVFGLVLFICYLVVDMVEWNLLYKYSFLELEYYFDNFIIVGFIFLLQCLYSF